MKKPLNSSSYRKDYYRYGGGLIIALTLTYLAYFATTEAWFSRVNLAIFLLCLAFVQLVVQLIFFLHLGAENKPRWTLWSVLYTFLMMLIIVLASIWIMHNMNYNMHVSPEQMTEFMLEQNKKGF